MPVDLEAKLAELCALWDESVAPVDVAEIVGRGNVDVGDLDDLDDRGADPPRRPVRSVWLLTAAAALVAALVGVLTRVGDDQSTADSDTAVVGFPNLTSTFVSPRNGFSVRYFDRGEGTVTPAEQLWGFSERVDDGFDVVETGLAAVFKGASTEFPGERPCLNTEYEPIPCGSIDEQIDRYLSDDYVLGGGCGVPRSQQVEITIDGQSGRIAECPNHIEATVVAGGRLYLFTLSHDRGDARAVFDAFVATIELTPETAVDFPGLTSTFVSPTYGYSFQYHDRGGLAPATELWDPVNQPLDSYEGDDRFDGVETGFGAYFAGASTQIPDGVSIDAWVDEYVSPGGCGVPRSQQAEITIDGQSGRIAECRNADGIGRIEATVVAGGRLYLFIAGHDRSDARAWFDAWVATIDLTPETAAVPWMRPAVPGLSSRETRAT